MIFSSTFLPNEVFYHWVHIAFSYVLKGAEFGVVCCLALISIDGPRKALKLAVDPDYTTKTIRTRSMSISIGSRSTASMKSVESI